MLPNEGALEVEGPPNKFEDDEAPPAVDPKVGAPEAAELPNVGPDPKVGPAPNADVELGDAGDDPNAGAAPKAGGEPNAGGAPKPPGEVGDDPTPKPLEATEPVAPPENVPKPAPEFVEAGTAGLPPPPKTEAELFPPPVWPPNKDWDVVLGVLDPKLELAPPNTFLLAFAALGADPRPLKNPPPPALEELPPKTDVEPVEAEVEVGFDVEPPNNEDEVEAATD